MPLLFNEAINRFTGFPATNLLNLGLELDATANDIDLSGALGLLCIRIIPYHLTRTVAQFAQAVANLRVSTSPSAHPVASKTRNNRTRIATATATRLIPWHSLEPQRS